MRLERFSERRGSSMKRGWWGSRRWTSCLAMGRWRRPWKSRAASRPRLFTTLRRERQDWRVEGESSQPMSSVAFIFMALKPWAWRALLELV